LVRGSDRYCPEHAAQRQAEYDARRGSAASRGYGRKWRKIRLMYLRRHPLCEDPYGVHAEHGETVPATEVDHQTPLREGGSHRVDNLQALCRACHSRKTAIEDGRWGQ
jgi:5-methylcytosine-specific restriction protein A